jgi:hypothetical protein
VTGGPRTRPPYVVAVSRSRRELLMSDDRIIKFAGIHDEDGDDVDAIEDAYMATAQDPLTKKWIAIRLADFPPEGKCH